ncbi:hypothetical protein [Oceanibaculum nanhaiense]|uniref:hypothetical protein n=1 Tax=Oceanibaculum nanhaiense TaxID=1909734 RepID=UPI00396D336E
MSRALKYADSAAPQDGTRAGSPDRSASSGVSVTLEGWKPGLNKVRLTQLLRDGGNDLAVASRMTGDLLDGKSVTVRLQQFDNVPAARSVLSEIGVETVRA